MSDLKIMRDALTKAAERFDTMGHHDMAADCRDALDNVTTVKCVLCELGFRPSHNRLLGLIHIKPDSNKMVLCTNAQ